MARAPENTRAAFLRAFEDGADGVECDVRLTKDGVPVIIHDPDTARLANKTKVVSQSTFAELQELEFGSYHGEVQRILSLGDLLELVGPDRCAYVELKASTPGRLGRAREQVKTKLFARRQGLGLVSSSSLPPITRGDRRLVRAVVAELRRRPNAQVVLHSFDPGTVRAAHRRLPSVPTGLLFEASSTQGAETVEPRHALRVAMKIGAGSLHPEHSLVGGSSTSELFGGAPVVVWTAKAADVGRLVKAGVHGIITNDPAETLAALK